MNIRHAANNAGCCFQHHKFIVLGMRDQHSSAVRPRCLESQGRRIVAEIPSRSPFQLSSSHMQSVAYLRQQGLVWKDCSVAHHVSTCSQASNARGYPKKCQVQPQWLVAQEMPEDAENLDSWSCNRM